MTLLKSGDNLLVDTKRFIADSDEVQILCAFVRVNKLKELLEGGKCSTLVIRWQTNDIIQEISDFEALYDYCCAEGITLFHNPKIHLKAIINDKQDVLFGSSNISEGGMGEFNFNLELSGITKKVDVSDRLYLQEIIKSSRLVDHNYYSALKEKIDILREQYTKSPDIPDFEIDSKLNKEFLLSSLPMSESPERLLELRWSESTKEDSFEDYELNHMIHDIVNYQVSKVVNRDLFESTLRNNFNNHPFILALKDAIRSKHNRFMGYTELCQWISDNTTTVPNPRRWEIKNEKKVQILHRWITYFDNEFKSEIKYPNGSDKIHYTGKLELLEEFIQSLRRDKARGSLAPHQILLLIALSRLFKENNSRELDLDVLQDTFEDVWSEYSHLLDRGAENLRVGMPLRAYYNLDYIEIDWVNTSEPLRDFRNLNVLRENSHSIRTSGILNLLLKENSYSEEQILAFL